MNSKTMTSQRGCGLIAVLCVLVPVAWSQSAEWTSVTYVKNEGLQAAIDGAPAYAKVIADRTKQVEIATTVRVAKPLTLVGLNYRLKPGLGNTPLIEILAEGVRLRDFVLEGNTDSVSQSDRVPLIVLRRGRFVIENGELNNSSKDGIMITPVAQFGHIEHGAIRNLTAKGTIRDVVSIGGAGDEGLFVRHLVVENIRAYGSRLRGPVEVSDGSEYITVRDVYAESCLYGVDVQDHNRKGQVNRHVIIDGVHVKDTPVAIRTANHDFGHDGLTIRNVTWTDGPKKGVAGRLRSDGKTILTGYPLDIKNTANFLIENVRVRGCPGEGSVRVVNSSNVTLRSLTFIDCANEGPALLVDDVNNALIDNVVFEGHLQPEIGVLFRIHSDKLFHGLRVRNVLASAVRGTGIVVENRSKSGGLASYMITDNLATVRADVKADRRLVRNNLPASPE